MPRHRGKFKPESPFPYELSRSRIENFVKCNACFYLEQVKGLKFPSFPGFNINEATDVLLKKDFDYYRKKQLAHPFLKEKGYDYLVPFSHPNFELWTQSLHFGAEGRFHIVHEKSNLKIGGGIDDVWINKDTDSLHIVDYKSTSQKKINSTITLDDWWKKSYKRQMDLYIWIFKKMGFKKVSNIGFFLYCDGDRFTNNNFLNNKNALMIFKMSILEYQSSLEWIEPTLMKIRKCLELERCPKHSFNCEYKNLFDNFE